MSFIYVTCDGGHRLKANSKLAGKTLVCPVCRTHVSVPAPEDTLSDTGVLRILGDAQPISAADDSLPFELRPCPRCHVQVRGHLSVCPACDCYIGVSPDYLKRLHDQPLRNTN